MGTWKSIMCLAATGALLVAPLTAQSADRRLLPTLPGPRAAAIQTETHTVSGVEVTAQAGQPASARVESLILRGPAGQPWSAAFTGRKTWMLHGHDVWEIARSYGYEFHPIVEHEWEALEGGTGGWDSKVVHEAVVQETRTRCRTLASVELGRMRAKCVSAPAGSRLITEHDRTRDFRMFAGKTLASGWKVLEMEASGGSWVKRPSRGASSLESVYRLTMRLDDPGESGFLHRIVLEGPASAESWHDAFRAN